MLWRCHELKVWITMKYIYCQLDQLEIQSFHHDGDPIKCLTYYLAGQPRLRFRWRNRVTVVVGYPWSRSIVLPWQSTISGKDSEWKDYASALLRIQGIQEDVRILLTPSSYGQTRLASTLDEDFLFQLSHTIDTHGWSLKCCVDVYNFNLKRHSQVLKYNHNNLVMIESNIMHCFWSGKKGWDDALSIYISPERTLKENLNLAEILAEKNIGQNYYLLTLYNDLPVSQLDVTNSL